jgi:hypothetical protein
VDLKSKISYLESTQRNCQNELIQNKDSYQILENEHTNFVSQHN